MVTADLFEDTTQEAHTCQPEGAGSWICKRCKRPLSDPESVRAGMGPVCRAKAGTGGKDMGSNRGDGRTVAELPFDPDTMDVVCERYETGERNPWDGRPVTATRFNISQRVVSHSPCGFEWGYGGSGPSDFALNILDLFLPCRWAAPEDCDDPDRIDAADVKCYGGQYVSRDAWGLHQDFKWKFVATLPKEGGTIKGADVRAWIAAELREKVLMTPLPSLFQAVTCPACTARLLACPRTFNGYPLAARRYAVGYVAGVADGHWTYHRADGPGTVALCRAADDPWDPDPGFLRVQDALNAVDPQD